MKGFVAASAVLGMFTVGGLPVLALTGTDSGTGGNDKASAAVAARQPGPPPWAHGHGRAGKPDKPDKPDKPKGQDDDDKGEDRDGDHRGQPGWARHGDAVPPGWAKHRPGATPHGWAMRAWAHCVADAAAGLDQGEKLDPEKACGARPKPPAPPDQRQ